jgi:phosphoglycerate dehydrogenase-like enzyme
MVDAAIRNVVVIHDQPDDFRDFLAARLPAVRFHYATSPAEIEPSLAAARPEALFSIKTSAFPGPAHRDALGTASIRWVHVGGSGYEHLLPLPRGGIRITTSVGVLARDLSETVMGGILALNGKLLLYRDQQRERIWRPQTFRPLTGQTILIVGLGAIGGWVAHTAKAMGMRVLAIRRQQKSHAAVDRLVQPGDLGAVIGEADFVTLHVRLDATTHHLIDGKMLAAMKPGAILVNTARGPVVDEAALIEALASGHLGGAYLDVFETEPLAPSSPLWSMENVFISPHAADNSLGWPRRFAELFADNIERWQKGEALANELSL